MGIWFVGKWIVCDRDLFEYQQWGRIWGFPIAKQVMNQCATSSGMVGYDCMGRLVIENTSEREKTFIPILSN